MNFDITSAKAAVGNIWKNAGGSNKNTNDTILVRKVEDKFDAVGSISREKTYSSYSPRAFLNCLCRIIGYKKGGLTTRKARNIEGTKYVLDELVSQIDAKHQESLKNAFSKHFSDHLTYGTPLRKGAVLKFLDSLSNSKVQRDGVVRNREGL